jgi:hypothetical protein
MSTEHDPKLYGYLCNGDEKQVDSIITHTKINPNMGLQGAIIGKLDKYVYEFVKRGACKQFAFDYAIVNNNISMVAYLIENGFDRLKDIPNRWGVPLINLGLNVEKLKTHSSYLNMMKRIYYHKQKTNQALHIILPKEIIRLINNFQQF